MVEGLIGGLVVILGLQPEPVELDQLDHVIRLWRTNQQRLIRLPMRTAGNLGIGGRGISQAKVMQRMMKVVAIMAMRAFSVAISHLSSLPSRVSSRPVLSQKHQVR